MIGFRLLDRYILSQWIRTFVLTALGFPLIAILIDLVDNLNKLLDRGVTFPHIGLSYLYSVPETISTVMPAAVLFATVFTVGALSRHSELTAAKAGGWSFHRLALPMFLAAAGATGLAVIVGELAPEATARKLELQKARATRPASTRLNFVYRGDEGWVYTIRSLEVAQKRLREPLFERQGSGVEYPSLVITADSGTYNDSLRTWKLYHGTSRVVVSATNQAAFDFEWMRLRTFRQPPKALITESKAPDEMRYAELRDYIDALKRSGNDTNKLEVDLALKFALPATCLVIGLFGAPLAITSQRSGAAIGVAFSLGTTVLFLLMIQISKAVGAGGVMAPLAAAWTPNIFFLAAALILLWRVRT